MYTIIVMYKYIVLVLIHDWFIHVYSVVYACKMLHGKSSLIDVLCIYKHVNIYMNFQILPKFSDFKKKGNVF